MTSDVIDCGEYRRRKQTRSTGPSRGPYSSRPGRMPQEIVRIRHWMIDAPEDPPLVKLAWLLSYFGAVPLPDGNIYRLERERLEQRKGEAWVRSTSTFDDLARFTHGLTRSQWQRIARGSAPRQVVYSLDRWGTRPPPDAPVGE